MTCFDHVIHSYLDLAQNARHAHLLHVVAPDFVGDQAETMRLLEKYRTSISALIDLGVDVIIPVHKGSISLSQIACQLQYLFGTNRFRLGLPSQRNPLSLSDINALLAHAPTQRIHMLGISPYRQHDFNPRVELIQSLLTKPDITCDANRLIAAIGAYESIGQQIHENTAQICENIILERHLYGLLHLPSAEPASLQTLALELGLNLEEQLSFVQLSKERSHYRNAGDHNTAMWDFLVEATDSLDVDDLREYIEHDAPFEFESLFWGSLAKGFRPQQRYEAIVEFLNQDKLHGADAQLFYSGMSCNRDFQAAFDAQVPIGVSLNMRSMTPLLRQNLLKSNAAGLPLFIDSGAFSVRRNPTPEIQQHQPALF